jgi:FKBP-type peptidyl-prolyl cis-trans isomerase
MKARNAFAWVWVGLVACSGCIDPRITPVMPPGFKAPKVAPPTAGSGAEAIGETVSAGNTGQPAISKIISEPTPVGQERKTASGMTYMTEKEGTGEMAKPGQTVKVHYVGRLENGTKFDASADRGAPFEFKIGVGGVIKGWDEGIPGMKIGEKRKLIIPSHMGYGAAGQPPTIPANSTLIFEVDLLDAK